MARNITIKAKSLSGFNNLIRKLERVLPVVAEDTVKTSCMAIEADAKQFCPVDTGRLRDSINTRIEDSRNEVIGIVSTNVEYANYVEAGTSKMAAKPYMKPAFDKNKKDIDKYFIEKLKSELR